MRGCQKKVIFLKNTGSELFEEAYFVVSKLGETVSDTEENMIIEANRIIEENRDEDPLKCEIRRDKLKLLLTFLLGVALGCTVILLFSNFSFF